VASLAGTWIALVAGLAGMRAREGSLSFAPRLPEGLTQLGFCIVFQGRHLRVQVRHDATSYQLAAGDPLTLLHFGEETTVSGTDPVSCRTPPLRGVHPGSAPATQPAGRAPRRRGARNDVDAREGTP